MRRIASVFSVLVVALAAACSTDRTTSSPLPSFDGAGLQPRANGLPTTPCPTLTPQQITDLIYEVFATGSPDANSARGKWDNIQKQKSDGNTAEVEAKTIDLIDFMLDKQRDGKLAQETETAAKLSTLLKALACFANIPFEFPVGSTGDYVDPSDPDRLIKTLDGQAAGFIPAGAVNARALFVITQVQEPLRTPLDKYPLNYDFSLYPNAGFNQKITLGICATAPDIGTLTRLKLGHNIGTDGFEILEPRDVGFMDLQCQAAQQTAQNSVVDRVLSALLPKKLYAAAFFGVGGVGGAASELSPFGPVDPRIRVTKITSGTSAPIGGTISPAPSVKFSTRKQVDLANITTVFATNSGTIDPSSVTSNASGIAGATSWTLGTVPGTVTATATPQIQGPVAVTNAYFVDENWEPITSVTFTAEATAPTKLVITKSPVNNASFVAGITHTPETIVQAQDRFDRVVPAYTGTVTLSAAAGTVAQPFMNGPATRQAVRGEAIFDNVAITKTGTFAISAAGAYNSASLNAPGSYNVIITPGAPIIEKIAGDAQTADAGVTLGLAPGTVAPRVRVRDSYFNLWTDRPVYWRTFDGGLVGATATTPSTSTSVTTLTGNPSGEASTTWTIGTFANELFASLTPGDITGSDFVVFTATGNRDRTVQSCAVGTSRESAVTNVIQWKGNKPPAIINSLELYLSITGNAGKLRVPIDVRLIAYESTEISRNVWSAPVAKASVFISNVPLKGNASEDAPVSFNFNGYVPTPNSRLTIRLFKEAGGDNGVIRFNTGNCTNSPFQTVLLSNGDLVRNSVAFQMR